MVEIMADRLGGETTRVRAKQSMPYKKKKGRGFKGEPMTKKNVEGEPLCFNRPERGTIGVRATGEWHSWKEKKEGWEDLREKKAEAEPN